jgi:MFS family permease
MPVFDKLMPNYVTASIALSFGGLLNGYDTGSIGAIVHMEQFKSSMGGAMTAFITGITVSTIMLTGIIPALFAGHLADKYGRLRLIAPGALVFGIGALLQATSTQLPQFIIGRAISGAGQGVFFGNITVYITEVAPLRSRGRLSALPQFMATTGVCIGYFACVSTTGQKSSLAWRLPYIVQVAVSAGLALVCRFLPESPRWLALQGRGDEAQISLTRLDFDLNEARRDFLATVQEQSSLSNWQSFVLLFRRGYRPKTFLALFILSMIQLSGIDAIVSFSRSSLWKYSLTLIADLRMASPFSSFNSKQWH